MQAAHSTKKNMYIYFLHPPKIVTVGCSTSFNKKWREYYSQTIKVVIVVIIKICIVSEESAWIMGPTIKLVTINGEYFWWKD